MNEQSIFTAALERDPSSRDAFLDEACGDDVALKERLQSLLVHHDRGNSFMGRPAGALEATLDQALDEPLGTMIGPYRLMEKIGEGGMGVVYVAHQEKPVTRKVALKVVKPGMDTKEVMGRFEAERQALALMDHPNIAKVLDAGATDSGRPYFVMELVRGIPITEYCDGKRLGTRERLSLFVATCQAVQHAHQKGVIHRDVKPSNILITEHDGTPLPKVIDFGVAKATNQRLTERTIYTRHQQMVGTPLYMSPEQAELSALDVDTRTDIYSLGVLLYELLTGVTPFDQKRFHAAAYDEIRRIIREEDPPKPSTRISTLAKNAATISERRDTDVRKLGHVLRGELDWVVMKALEKDRTRRYETALGFALDVQRYLDGETVKACPPSTAYRVRKFVRRNRTAVATGVALSVLLVAGILGTSTGWLAEARARRDLESRQQEVVDARDTAVAAMSRESELRSRERELRAVAEQQRAHAEDQRSRALMRQYIAEVQNAHNAIQAGHNVEANEILHRWVRSEGEADQRGWEWYFLLDQARDDRSQAVYGHRNQLLDIALSADGEHFASVSEDGTARIWKTATGEQIKLLDDFPGAPGSVVWCPTRNVLGIGLSDGSIQIVDAESFDIVARIETEGGAVGHLDWSHDGELIASGWADRVRVWQSETGELLQTINVDEQEVGEYVQSLAWAPNSNRLAVFRVGSIVVWDPPRTQPTLHIDEPKFRVDLRDGVARRNWVGHQGAWSPDGLALVAVVRTGPSMDHISLFSAESGQLIERLGRSEHAVHAFAWSPDGRTVVGGGRGDFALRKWDVESQEVAQELRGHGERVSNILWSNDGRTLLSASDDYSLRIWKERPRDPNSPFEGHTDAVLSVAWSPDGSLLASGGRDNVVRVWDARSRECLRTLEGHTNEVSSVRWRGDGLRLASASMDGTVRVWDLSTGREKHKIETSDPFIGSAWTADGREIVTTSTDGIVTVWDSQTGNVDRRLTAHVDSGADIAVSSDGRFVASLGVRDLWVWDVGTDDVILHEAFRGYMGVGALAFSPDNKSLAWSIKSAVRIVDLESQEIRAALDGHSATINGLAWSPDNERLVTGSDDGTVRIWHAQLGQETLRIVDPGGPVKTVAWSPDGSAVLSGSVGRMIRKWSIEGGLELARDPGFDLARTTARLRNARRDLNEGNSHAAQVEFSSLIESGVADWSVWAGRGNAYARARDWDRALEDLSQAVLLAPKGKLTELLRDRAVLYCYLGQFELFFADCRRLLEFAQSNPADKLLGIRVAAACALHPDTARQIDGVEELYEEVAEYPLGVYGIFPTLRSWIDLRRGDYARALKSDFEYRWVVTQRFNACFAALFAAHASASLGAEEDARRTLAQAKEHQSIRATAGNWGWDLSSEILEREVTELVGQR